IFNKYARWKIFNATERSRLKISNARWRNRKRKPENNAPKKKLISRNKCFAHRKITCEIWFECRETLRMRSQRVTSLMLRINYSVCAMLKKISESSSSVVERTSHNKSLIWKKTFRNSKISAVKTSNVNWRVRKRISTFSASARWQISSVSAN